MEFRSIFPSPRWEGSIFNEDALLKLLFCLPTEYVSEAFLESILKYPLEDILGALAERGVIIRDKNSGSCLLPLSHKYALGPECRPLLKDALPLMELVKENLEGTENSLSTADWLNLGKNILKQFNPEEDPKAEEFQRFLVKKYCETGNINGARDLLQNPVPQAERPGTFSKLESQAEDLRLLLPYASACDVLIFSREGIAAGLRYDDENMFAPMISVLEQGPLAAALAREAESLGVPVVTNKRLAANLFSFGKLGETIPEICSRDLVPILYKSGSKRTFRFAGKRRPSVKIPRPLKIEFGAVLWVFLEEEQLSPLSEALAKAQKRISRLLGYRFPKIRISKNDKLDYCDFRILLKGVEAVRCRLELVSYGGSPMEMDGEQFIKAAYSAANIVIGRLDDIILRRAPDFLGRDDVQAILDMAEEKYPAVTSEVKSFLSLGSVRDILRSLLSEQVSLRHIQVILEALADWSTFGPVPHETIIEQIRQSLKRQICLDYSGGGEILKVLTLEERLEAKFADRSILHEGMDVPNFQGADDWVDAFSPAIKRMEEKGLPPIVLCSPVARPWVKEMTRKKFPALAVLSYIEIPPEMKVEPVGEIKIGKSKPKGGTV
jgi:flagellar biosynthesis protein FlhA